MTGQNIKLHNFENFIATLLVIHRSKPAAVVSAEWVLHKLGLLDREDRLPISSLPLPVAARQTVSAPEPEPAELADYAEAWRLDEAKIHTDPEPYEDVA